MNSKNNNDFINSAIKASGGKLSNDDIKAAAKSGDASKLLNQLSNEDKAKINKMLNDKAALSALLKSPQAAELIKKLSGGGKNG